MFGAFRFNVVVTRTVGVKVRKVVFKHCCIEQSTKTTKCPPASSSPGSSIYTSFTKLSLVLVAGLLTGYLQYFSGCDVNARRKLGPGGEGGDVVSCQHTPLLMCCSWGLSEVVVTLLQHRADTNAKDCDGKTALHVAIENQHQQIVATLLTQPDVDLMTSDNNGATPFGAALATKNNKAAQAIVHREPQCAEQVRHFFLIELIRA